MTKSNLLQPGDGGTLESEAVDEVDLVEPPDPTVEMYEDLNRAHHILNERLFGGRLAPCLITLRARGRSMGNFSPHRFVREDGRRSHEIALNPEAFGDRTIEHCLATLTHEMVHQAQFDAGTAGRRGYHNSDFARRMSALGLPTSSTGVPGGASVGEDVGQYIQANGAFLKVAQELIDTNFRAGWGERAVSEIQLDWEIGDEAVGSAPGVRDDRTLEQTVVGLSSEQNRPTADLSPAVEVSTDRKRRRRSDPSKVKFLCPSCGQAAWGKTSLSIFCGKCSQPMAAALWAVKEDTHNAPRS